MSPGVDSHLADSVPDTAETEAPAISVVIPTFNRGHLLGRALESCRSQTVSPHEIVVVDDGSTDDTGRIVGDCGRDGSIRFLRQPRRGCAAARDHGVAEATGNWIAFLDSDDMWAPTHLERLQQAVLDTAAGADVYFADACFPTAPTDEASTLWTRSGFEVEGPHHLAADATDWVLRPQPPMKLPATLVRREAYLREGGLLEDLPTREDSHFFLRMGIGRPVCAVHGDGVRIGFDDVPENRLAVIHPASGRVYLDATVRLHRDVLARTQSLDRRHRRELRRRLATARLRLARLDFSARRLGACVIQLLRASWLSPHQVLGAVGRTLRRCLP